MRETTAVNRGWKYCPSFKNEYTEKDFDDSSWENASLPHANIEIPYNGFDEKIYQFVSCYRRALEIPSGSAGRRIFLDFEGVMSAAEVWVNGKRAGSHRGGYTPFSVDITDFVQAGGANSVAVMVDSTEREDIPPFGKVVDYLCYGGIYREVSLRITDEVYMENVFARPGKIDADKKSLEVRVFLRNAAAGEREISISAQLKKDGESLAASSFEQLLSPGTETVIINMDGLKGIELWGPDSPVLYDVEVSISREGVITDACCFKTGFRSAVFKADGFYLNGSPLKLTGLNRHQSYPYAGYAMPARAQKKDADIIKFELGCNIVRTSHYPQSRHFLDRCDETGLLVFEEIPGWQYIGGEDWKNVSLMNLREMIQRDWNRPSVVLWGVRINESEDDHDFYAETNRAARELDDTRQTGGVRYTEKSEFLEDVYTMNDFIHSGGKEVLRKRKKVTGGKKVPYLITEYNGHMYPTKRFDQEERLVEHALRHLRVLDRSAGDRDIAGAIGWCAFDYNTHREFGSGDRICYHGVCDMFRIPKYAAAAYAGAIDPEKKIVLEPATLFAQGEKSAARILPVYVFTNCDYIKLVKNGKEIGDYYPAFKEFPNIKHPPVIIRDLVGSQLDNSRFSPEDRVKLRELISFIMINGEEKLTTAHYLKIGIFLKKYKMKFTDGVELFMNFITGWGASEQVFELRGYYGGREAAVKCFGSGAASSLVIEADDSRLNTGDWDTTRITAKLLDQYGNIMPFVNEYIQWKIHGPAQIIGPEMSALCGGVSAAWIRTQGTSGTVTVQARCSRFESAAVKISVEQGTVSRLGII